MLHRIARLSDPSEVAEVVASRLLHKLIALQQSKGEVHLCLTGGSTANRMYEHLARLAPGSELDPALLQLWWGDDQFVAATDEARNSLQAITRLGHGISLKATHMHIMPAKEGRMDADDCAAEYASTLGTTHFDITLLGMGPDGHVGAVFPQHPSFEKTSRRVIGVSDAPIEPQQRITLTIPALNNCDEMWMIATGKSKANAVARALGGDHSLPAAWVQGDRATYWFLDLESASELPASYTCLL